MFFIVDGKDSYAKKDLQNNLKRNKRENTTFILWFHTIVIHFIYLLLIGTLLNIFASHLYIWNPKVLMISLFSYFWMIVLYFQKRITCKIGKLCEQKN
jgi:hypothetical protein